MFYGIGATKAGTSWLYRTLSAHPDCYLRSVKELHYFTSLGPKMHANRTEFLETYAQRFRDKLANQPDRNVEYRVRHLADIMALQRVMEKTNNTHSAYLDYLCSPNDATTICGDITPAYATLSAGKYRLMDGLVPDTRFIFLMRDPVARIWSHLKMLATREARQKKVTFEEQIEKVFNRYLNGVYHEVDTRADYTRTLENLFKAITQERRLCLYFEDIFGPNAPDTRAQLSTFLDLTTPLPLNEDRVHGGNPTPLTQKQGQALFQKCASQYDGVAQLMGDDLPDAWTHSLNLYS